MVGKSIRQTMFRQSKGYPTAYRGWQGEKGYYTSSTNQQKK